MNTSPTLIGIALVWSQQIYLKLLKTMRYFDPFLRFCPATLPRGISGMKINELMSYWSTANWHGLGKSTHSHGFLHVCSYAGLPDENFNKKPNSAKKSQTDCLKARKKAKFYLRYCHSFVTKKHLNYKNIKKMSSKLR